MSAKITMDHLAKFLQKKMRKGNYGQVRLHLNDGEITFVNYQEDYNAATFIDNVETPVNRLVVKSKKNNGADLIKKDAPIDQNVSEIAEIVQTGEKTEDQNPDKLHLEEGKK